VPDAYNLTDADRPTLSMRGQGSKRGTTDEITAEIGAKRLVENLGRAGLTSVLL
jgi:hypothetical protein